jgi:ABC-type nitrate/sulfonate/bicarbonate transport system substrate-binding protein
MRDVQALDTYCATLRTALATLVEAVEYAASMPAETDPALRPWYAPQWAVDHAQRVLAMDHAGAQAQRDLALQTQIAALAYTFADFLHARLLECPRSAADHVASPDEVLDALRELDVLTQATFAEAAEP